MSRLTRVLGMSPSTVQGMPVFAGYATLAIGAVLVAAPRRVAAPLGLERHVAALRAMGACDLALVPGLLRGRPRWPWMAGRAALNVVQAAYLHRLAPRSTTPAAVHGTAGLLVALTAIDGATALELRRGAS